MTHINKTMARHCMPRYSTTKKSSSDNYYFFFKLGQMKVVQIYSHLQKKKTIYN